MIRTVLGMLPPARRRTVAAHLALTALSLALRAVGVVLLVPIVQELFGPTPAAAWSWVLLLVGVTAVGWVVDTVISRLGFTLGFALLEHAEHLIAERLTMVRLSWFSAENTSLARQAIAANGPDMAGFFAYIVTPLLTGIGLPVAIALALLPISPLLGAAALAGVPALLLAFWASRRISHAADQADEKTQAELTERIVEFARTQEALRAARRADAATGTVAASLRTRHSATVKLLFMQVPGQLLLTVATQIALILLAGAAAWLMVRGDIDAPAAIALIVVIIRYLEPFNAVADLAAGIDKTASVFERFAKILAAPLQRTGDGNDVIPAEGSAPRVELRDVTFRYSPNGPNVLQGLTITFDAGSTTAIIGPSGSGKSTIVGLIAGLCEPTEGSILIDGIDASALAPAARRSLVSMIFQQPYLFDGTIRDNIASWDAPGTAHTRDIDAAVRLARVDEIVDRLPAGLDSTVGEAGGSLSGGERQRVSIARALVKEAPVLLVDEATSALDTENEKAVVAALAADPIPRTRVVVAHRLASIRTADRVVMLSAEGHVIEDGELDLLLAAGGRFSRFWQQRSDAARWRLTDSATLSH